MYFPIDHPLASNMSVLDENQNGAYATKNHFEIAFFDSEDNFITQPIPEFSQYADVVAGDTLIYSWVPKTKVFTFLKQHIYA